MAHPVVVEQSRAMPVDPADAFARTLPMPLHTLFGYTISQITGPMAPLVGHVEGEWVFTPHGTGTKVTWRWTLHPRSALTAPALPVFGRIWKGYARQALESLTDYLLT